ncbi:ankyrin [Tuber magnatum]|uniref:Ankyrin n=1 Tax=Tuber magnatum TaxID=42249 RepID=A0A317T1P4_9PEZI|nr:ankyrin [Tuber magnatum]
MSFTTLPPELCLQIASYLPTPSLYRLIQTSRQNHNLLLPLLHAHALRPLVTCTSLHNAIETPHPALFTLLLHLSHPLNTLNAAGHTPLHTALIHRREYFFHVLLHAGADPHIPTRLGETPLHTSVLHDDPGAVEALIAAGVDVNAKEADWILDRLAREAAAHRGWRDERGVEDVVAEARREAEILDAELRQPVYFYQRSWNLGKRGPGRLSYYLYHVMEYRIP